MRSRDGRTIDEWDVARFAPHATWETFGVEDARLTAIDGRWYFTYVAVSPHGVCTALASTSDFVNFQRHGVIFCPENKDVVLFPEKMDGDYFAIHRPNGSTPFSAPQMWIARSPDLIHWGGYQRLLGGTSRWEGNRIGAGTPPLRVDDGWLEIYHGSQASSVSRDVGIYSAGALLLKEDQPGQVVGRSQDVVLAPRADFERQGFVPNVVFPTGIVEREETFFIYYGAADTCTGVVGVERRELLSSLA